MDDRCYRVAGKERVQRGAVADVAFDEGRGFACQRADAAQRFGGAVDEVVEDDDVMPCLQEDEDGVRADVAGAAGDENHGSLLLLWV